MMSNMDLIRSRRSVRTFDGRPLKEDELESILNCAKSVENPYGLPITWKILSAKADGLSSPVITGTDTFIAGKLHREAHAEEAFGFAFEKVVLFAASKGIGTTWIAGTMDRSAFERAMDLKDDEVMPCVSPLGYPTGKMSLRESMMRMGVKADSRLSFGELFFSGSFDTPLTEEKAGDLSSVLEMIRWAPSAVNKQPWRIVVDGDAVHFYEKKGRGFTAADGWDIQKIDMGIAMCHFDIGIGEMQRKAALSLEEPDIPHPADTVYIASFHLT